MRPAARMAGCYCNCSGRSKRRDTVDKPSTVAVTVGARRRAQADAPADPKYASTLQAHAGRRWPLARTDRIEGRRAEAARASVAPTPSRGWSPQFHPGAAKKAAPCPSVTSPATHPWVIPRQP